MNTLWDIAVVGGGINGAGIARDAAGRGASVLLLEAQDLAAGTSSASTKLIHGGLRYLEHYEFGLVREALSERERIWSIAPHIVWPMRFVLPHVRGLRPMWLLRLGLFFYDHIGGRKLLPATSTIDLASHPAGVPLKGGFGKAFVYSDCWVDDARLVVLNARDAADRGATVRTRCEVEGLVREESHWRISTSQGEFRAKAVVNAAGPAVLDLMGRAQLASGHGMRLVRGSHVVVRRLFDHAFAYFFQNPDGRIFFAIPYERDFTLIGTTDADHVGGLRGVTASQDEIAYICDAASAYFARGIRPEDVIWSFAGVRPLLDDGSGRPEAATRGYRLELTAASEGAPFLSVFGGKITTYRHLAQEAVNLLKPRVANLIGREWTDTSPLPGGDFPANGAAALRDSLRARFDWLQESWADRMVKAYGTLAFDILGDAPSLAACGQHFGHGLTECEVRYLVEREWASNSDDILWRRTKLGLLFDADETAALDRAISGMRQA